MIFGGQGGHTAPSAGPRLGVEDQADNYARRLLMLGIAAGALAGLLLGAVIAVVLLPLLG